MDYNLIGTEFDPTMGSGGGALFGGRGGGRITITTPRIEIKGSKNGTISADGSDASDDEVTGAAFGGGSGGSIVIIADEILGHGKITANGGNGVFGGGGGSGGRIYIESSKNTSIDVFPFAHGGASTNTTHSANLEYCRGASGTIYVSTPKNKSANTSAVDVIIISSFEQFAPGAPFVSALTLLSDAEMYPDLLNVTVFNGATLGITSLILSTSNPHCGSLSYLPWCSRLNVTNARLSSKRVLDVAGNLADSDISIRADSIEFGKNALAVGELTLSIHCRWLQVRKAAVISFAYQMIVTASTNIDISGSIQQRSPTELSCWNGTAIYSWSCASIDYETAKWMGANERSGMIALSSNNLITLQSNSSLVATGIMLCAQELQVARQASIATDSFGCAAGAGIGCGFYDGGGGFGGIGGASTTLNPNSICAGRIYGNYDFINVDDSNHFDLYVGSGGGCLSCEPQTLYSRGGGIVSIEAPRFIHNGLITASGGSFETSVITVASSGGGAGGSVVIKSSSMIGAGIIRANGGQGQNGGGGGGGGRIMYDALGNYDTSQYIGAFFVSGGQGGIAGNPGVITPPTCPIGTSTTYDPTTGILGKCTDCAIGFYKDNAGNGACLMCTNKPSDSFYEFDGETSSDCSFRCNTGLIYRFNECLTSFEVFYTGIGGLAVFSVFAVSTLLFLFAPFIVMRNLRAMGFCKKKAMPFTYSRKQTLSTKLTHDWFTGVSGISNVTAMQLLGDDDDLAAFQSKIAKEDEAEPGQSLYSKASGALGDAPRQRVRDELSDQGESFASQFSCFNMYHDSMLTFL